MTHALDDLEFHALKDWLRGALHGQQPLPSITPDEHPYIGVMRLEQEVQRSTIRLLERACQELTLEVVAAPDAHAADYADNLLRLAVSLRIEDLADPLARLAERPTLADDLRRHVLGALIDLRVGQPPAFWDRILTRIGKAPTDLRLVVTTFSGLLQHSIDEALAHLPRLPDDPFVADSVVGAFDALQSSLEEPARTVVLHKLRAALPACNTALQSSFAEWLPSVAPVAPRPRNLSVVDAALEKFFGRFVPTPHTARLCPT